MSITRTLLLTAVAPMAWGTTYLVTTELLPGGHPMLAGLLRALPAGLLALAIGRTLPRGEWWLKAALLGVLNIGAFFPLLFLAAERLSGGVAGGKLIGDLDRHDASSKQKTGGEIAAGPDGLVVSGLF